MCIVVSLGGFPSVANADSGLQKRLSASELTSSNILPFRHDLFSSVALETGIPQSVIEKIAMAESRSNPALVNQESGASGLFQILPSTALEMERRGLIEGYKDPKQLLDPDMNAYVFAANIGWLKNYYGIDQIENEDDVRRLVAGHLLGGRGGKEWEEGKRRTSKKNEDYIEAAVTEFRRWREQSRQGPIKRFSSDWIRASF